MATRAFSVSLGGFDTHADEKAPHSALVGMLDRAVTAFIDRVSATEQGKKTTVAIYSEFGRRVKANASDGTDHGAAPTSSSSAEGSRAACTASRPI